MSDMKGNQNAKSGTTAARDFVDGGTTGDFRVERRGGGRRLRRHSVFEHSGCYTGWDRTGVLALQNRRHHDGCAADARRRTASCRPIDCLRRGRGKNRNDALRAGLAVYRRLALHLFGLDFDFVLRSAGWTLRRPNFYLHVEKYGVGFRLYQFHRDLACIAKSIFGDWFALQCRNAGFQGCHLIGHCPQSFPDRHLIQQGQNILHRYHRVILPWLQRKTVAGGRSSVDSFSVPVFPSRPDTQPFAVADSVWAAWVASGLGGRIWNGSVSCPQGRADREAMPCR